MSRLVCPSTGTAMRPRACPGDSYERMLHTTSVFDGIVEKYKPSRRIERSHRIPSLLSVSTEKERAQRHKSADRRSPVQGESSFPVALLDEPQICLTAAVEPPAAGDGTPNRSKRRLLGDAMVSFLTTSQTANEPAIAPEASSSVTEDVPLPLRESRHAAEHVDSEASLTTSAIVLSSPSPSRTGAVSPVLAARPSDEWQQSFVMFPHNRCRPRNALVDTLHWATAYTRERQHVENMTDVEQDEELKRETSSVWQLPELSPLHKGRASPVRPGDSIAQKLEKSRIEMKSRFLTKVRQYMAHVEVMVEKENEQKKLAAEAAAVERKRQQEWAAAHPFELGGVLDKTFTSIAQVAEPKFSSLANRYYSIAYRHRLRDIELKENYVVKMETHTYRLGSIMTYNEFVVCYRQFHRYASPNSYLIIAQIPKNGWLFVDKVIKALITRKIDKSKTGKIQFPDLLKHLFPAMSIEEILGMIPNFEKQYLAFIDKSVRMFLDTIDPDKVNHFGTVFSIVDKLGNGKVLRDEFVNGMPIDREAKEDEEQVKAFLESLFDAHARRDMNEKLELIGEPYLDLDNLGEALSIPRYNAYGGTMMGH